MKTRALLSSRALTLGLAALLLPAAHAAHAAEPAAPAFRPDGLPADATFDWSGLIRFAAPAAPSREVQPLPQAAGQNAFVDYNNPGGGVYLGSDYTVPAGGDTYNNLYVGIYTTGTAEQYQDTLTLNLLTLGSNAGSNGSYTLGGGTLSASQEYVGYYGTGTFTQTTGSTNTISSTLYVGQENNGTYNLNGGTLSVIGYESIGEGGTGTFTQNGGSHTVTGEIYLGDPTTGGTYNLNSSTLTTARTQVTSCG